MSYFWTSHPLWKKKESQILSCYSSQRLSFDFSYPTLFTMVLLKILLFWPILAFVFFLECCFNFVFLYICDIPHVWCVRLYHSKVMHPIFSFDLNSFIIFQLTINGHKILLFLWFYKAHLAWTLQPGPWYSQNFSVSVCLRQIKRYALNNCPAFVARFNAARIQMESIKESSQAASWIVQGTLQVHKCL